MASPLASAQNDFETGSNSFTYAIQASSDGSNFGDAVDVTLNVTDIDDNTPVIAANQSFSYAEGQVADAVVATVSASDADTNTGAFPNRLPLQAVAISNPPSPLAAGVAETGSTPPPPTDGDAVARLHQLQRSKGQAALRHLRLRCRSPLPLRSTISEPASNSFT